MNTFDPVRSRIINHERGGLVLRWETTGESPLLYVFGAFASTFFHSLGLVMTDPALALASPAVMWGNAEGMIGICITTGMFILMTFSCVLTCF
jgi:hypothetical protein